MDGGGENEAAAETLYELFFDMSEMLCSRYYALTPFAIRREKCGEVFLLVGRINAKTRREKGIKKNETVRRTANGDIVIRRKAKDDGWY